MFGIIIGMNMHYRQALHSLSLTASHSLRSHRTSSNQLIKFRMQKKANKGDKQQRTERYYERETGRTHARTQQQQQQQHSAYIYIYIL